MIKDFDAQRFANVVRKAQGNRTQKSFALECGISIPRMCNMINGKISQPPTQRTLQKIADNAQNNVTLHDLVLATTSTPSVSSNTDETEPRTQEPQMEIDGITRRLTAGLILNALTQLPCQSTALTEINDSKMFDPGILTCEIEFSNSIDLWQFRFVASTDTSGKLLSKEQFKKNLIHELGYIAYNNYKRTYNLSDEGNFLLESFPDIMTDEEYEVLKDSKIFKPLKEFEHAKISLVVTTKAAFNVLANSTQFTSLNLWMSVILIDYNSFSVVKETYITTALPHDIPQQDTSIQFKEVSSKI